MRLLHTADWHLGRLTLNHSREPDLREAVGQVVEVARERQPDLIIHAGDLFDGLRPSYHDLQWGMDALRELAAVAPTVVICGNHDSPALFALLDRLVGGPGARLRFIARAGRPAEGGILEYRTRAGERVKLAPIPFIHPNRMVDELLDPASWMANYADQVGQVIRTLVSAMQEDYRASEDVLLVAAHLHVAGARFSGSERMIHVTDAYATHDDGLTGVSYAAYGHIHRPQPLPGIAPGRYSGSLVPLDFGELGEAKEVVLVDAQPARPARVEPVPLTAGRPLVRLEGSLEEIAARAAGTGPALCQVVVRSPEPVPQLSERLVELLPQAVLLDVREEVASRSLKVLSVADAEPGAEEGFQQLFRIYLAESPVRDGNAEQVAGLFATLLEAVEEERLAVLPDLERLEQGEPPPAPATGDGEHQAEVGG